MCLIQRHILSHALSYVFQGCVATGRNMGLVFSYLINSLQKYSCCHCLSGSTVSTEQLWVFSSDLLTASCLQDGHHSSKHHTYVIWRQRKNRAKLLGLSFLKIKATALLEVLEQIPAHIAVARSRLNNDPSVEKTGKWLTIQLLSWEAGRERVCNGCWAADQQPSTLCTAPGFKIHSSLLRILKPKWG